MSVFVDIDLCDGCRRCLRTCPYDAVEIVEGKARIGDRCTDCAACLAVCKTEALRLEKPPRTIPDFSEWSGVFVFIETRSGAAAKVSLELLGAARELAKELGETVSAVLLGHQIGALSSVLFHHGAGRVYLADHPEMSEYRTLAYTRVLADLIVREKPGIFLFGATAAGRDLAPRVARRSAAGLTADCTGLFIDPADKILMQVRPAFGGNIMATIANRYSRPQMATVRPGVMTAKPVPENTGEVISVPVNLDSNDRRERLRETVTARRTGIDLSRAKVIVAGGRGAGGERGFSLLRELAAVMGGEVAGTRVAVESGWISPEQQVGQTGRTVRPEIYIACGVSGAVQHRAGMTGSRYVIAVNKDQNAPIFQTADWGIVGDLFDVVPELIRRLRPEP
jgi:electron transfer flavoprotein alpha subunit